MSSSQSQRLLAGSPLQAGPEPYDAHLARLGPIARGAVRDIVPALDACGLLGRGGAGFPVGRKWRALAERSAGHAVVVANGAEGEPGSLKDRVLMATRPHLVLDGVILAAEAIGANEIVLYIGTAHLDALNAMTQALRERRAEMGRRARIVQAPARYVAGEATAAVNCVNTGDALPTTTPPRVSERGVGGRPTLVQNVESLAHAALIARFGERWYRSAGRAEVNGTALVTLTGAVAGPQVREIEYGITVADIAGAAGVVESETRAVVLGGYFGTWAATDVAWNLPLDPVVMQASGLTFGCGMVGLLPASACGVSATARILRYMAAESAGQCGPCMYGLGTLAEATARIAHGQARADDLARIEQLAARTAGRGACHHPDGAVQLLTSALAAFGAEFRDHARTRRCPVEDAPSVVAARARAA